MSTPPAAADGCTADLSPRASEGGHLASPPARCVEQAGNCELTRALHLPSLTYMEARHLDLEFYDHFFRPGAYLRSHAEHMKKWH